MHTVRIIGPGRAGRSLAAALAAAGWDVADVRRRGQAVDDATDGVDVLLLTVPDGEVAAVSRSVRPSPHCTVLHCSGCLGLDVLADHPRRGSLHPLVPLPDPVTGARRLAGGVTFAVAGDPMARAIADALGGVALEVPDERRAAYHAAACIAANHVVALLGQVERVAAEAGLPLAAYLPLARAALDDVAAAGPAAALTGPAARGDRVTLARHLDVLPADERDAYLAGVALAGRLAAQGAATAPGADPGPTGTGSVPGRRPVRVA